MSKYKDESNGEGFRKSINRGQSDRVLTPEAQPPLRPGDAYMEGPYLVFTAAYHHRRGYCCNSDCRHCPYK